MDNGRDSSGRFTKGNPGGPGNPHAGQVSRLRSAMLEAVTDDDLRAIIGRLVELARGGDVRAAREVLDRTLGKPRQAVELATEQAEPRRVEFVNVDNRTRDPEQLADTA